MASKSAIATTGHNIANTNTEGYSRQTIDFRSKAPVPVKGVSAKMGSGVDVANIHRVNDEYLEKQIRHSAMEMGNLEERSSMLERVEDIFNEVEGEGLNRVLSQFFNNFRQLANDPQNEAIRHTVRESTQAVVDTVRRLYKEVDEVRKSIDSRVEGYSRELNSFSKQLAELNQEIERSELHGVTANDLRDKRDLILKKIASLVDVSVRPDEGGSLNVDLVEVGPLVVGPQHETFETQRTAGNLAEGKRDNTLDLIFSGSASKNVTHTVRGGRLGALIETRDKTLAGVSDRLDDLAFSLSRAVNQIHSKGTTPKGVSGINYFEPLEQKFRAAEFLALSKEVRSDVNLIATAAKPGASGDNRIAIAISGLQHLNLMNDGQATADEYYNGIVGDVGVTRARVMSDLEQQGSINGQLQKLRDQISGVSLDEETTHLMQFQHSYDASAKVIQIADEMLQTVLNLGP